MRYLGTDMKREETGRYLHEANKGHKTQHLSWFLEEAYFVSILILDYKDVDVDLFGYLFFLFTF